MGKYKIYRGFLPNGKEKIGCTNQYPTRCIVQSMTDYYVMEEHDCEFIASDREIELQIKHLGERDSRTPYHVSLHNRPKGITDKKKLSEMGKKGWIASREKYTDMNQRLSKGSKGKATGEKNSSAKLTEDKVRYIRKWCKVGVKGPYSYQRMATALGVTKGHISNVVARRIWSHI